MLTQIRTRRQEPLPTPRTLFEGREVGGFRFSTPLEQKLLRKMTRAVDEFDMLADGDRIMVCVSGGKDSYALLDLLRLAQRRSPVRFELLALNVDQGWPGYATDVIEGHLRREGVKYRMLTENYARIVEAKLEPGQTPCVLCSRFRRGFLYKLAPELGCNKIALGHHADDLCETLVMNMFYSGRLGTMPPKLHSSDGRNTVIRPMAFIMEQEVRDYATHRGYPLVRCGCPSCGLPDQKRQVVKRLLTQVSASDPDIKHQMLAAMKNVRPSQLLDSSLGAR